ncbi:MAG TPA: hypothetical protein VHH33_05915 [Nitrososphaeraceae archaeon]|jgi:hypothetical protein|nr:hypothetical protein [Nitrososphaeraceae archaeon]
MISEILDNSGFNTLIYDDAFAKICLIASIISEFQNQYHNDNHSKIVYLDLDAAFTSYVKAGLIPSMEIQKIDDHIYQSKSSDLKIYLPSEDIFDIIIIDIIKSMKECSLLIFDSINSFYNIFYNKEIPSSSNRLKIGNLNQLLYFVLMMILKHTSHFNIPFLVTSMIRYKRKEVVTSNRLLSKKSSLNFYVKIRNLNDLSITILGHPKTNQKNFIIKDKVLRWT